MLTCIIHTYKILILPGVTPFLPGVTPFEEKTKFSLSSLFYYNFIQFSLDGQNPFVTRVGRLEEHDSATKLEFLP